MTPMRAMTRRWLAVLAFVGGFAAWRATAFLPGLNGAPASAPPPDRATTTATTTTGARLARRVAVVVLDGLRFDASRELPTLRELRARGADLRARAPFPSLSGPSYVTLLTGLSPRYSGVRTNDRLAELAQDSLVARVRDAGLRVGYVATSRTPFASLVPSIDHRASDPGALSDDLVVVVTMAIDRAGHRHGGASEDYRAVVRAQDAVLAATVASLDLTRDAIVVVSDHGHTDRGGHGGTSGEELEVPLVLAGAGIRRGAVVERADLTRVSATVAVLLGVPAPSGSGPALREALALDAGRAGAVAAADAERTARVAALAAEADRREEDVLARARRLRRPLAALAIGAMLAVLWIARRRGTMAFDRSAALGPTFTIVWFATITIGQRWLSSPGVSGDAGSLWLEHARYGAAASIVWVISLAAIARSRARVEALAGVVAIGLVVAVAVALAPWAAGGDALAATLSSPLAVMVTPVAAMGVAWYAAATAVALGIVAIGSRVALRSRR